MRCSFASTDQPATWIAPRQPRPLADQRQHDVDRRRRRAGQPAELLHRGDQRVDLHRPAALEVLQHRGLVRADRRPRRRCAGRRRSGNCTPSASPIACASTIMARATARVPSSATISSSVPPVSAEIGLKERLPQSLTQISLRMSARTGAVQPGRDERLRQAPARARVFSPDGSPSGKRSPSTWRMTPGASISAGEDRRRSRWRAPARSRPRSFRRDRPPRCARPSCAPPCL